MQNYWVWTSHGEDYNMFDNNSEEDAFTTEPTNPYVAMVSDAFGNTEAEAGFDQMNEEEPNPEAKKFYDILDAAEQPIYEGCKEGLSKLSLAARLMSLKTDFNLSQKCMDSIAKMMQDYLPEGHNYSLWPVILTPYNLPPEMCMKQEFMFLTILVPGPKHPKRSLDIFLQPLIEELKDLWFSGVEAYDISTKQNFLLRAVLMWTISDFPAYAMLSGWTTHGRLACPYCLDKTDAFQLKNGRKTSWFDCHRCFLPEDHGDRQNVVSFRKGRVVKDSAPPILTGEEFLNKVCGFPKTVAFRGKSWKKSSRIWQTHNWHKQSIFWELPYWKVHLLRHNLDVMHIEKNFFDNIINTLLDVKGRTKDKSNHDSICKSIAIAKTCS
ncbi:unnamed protein product [Microthlaspi erraticum]|uniref:Transposase-associated domain-containing protein n=1 Tax=Microthlaspi erraticum TaxID=1685480 RepID=A0A6D2HCR3_9BRAS|nr:unnamed protein product [Microthlaspi erraticum]